jgi:hypothetical protein
MDEPICQPMGNSQSTKKGKQQTVLKTTKRGGVRSKKNRNKKHNKTLQFSIMGINSARLKAKKDSLINNIEILNNPSCITIQESKLRNSGQIKLKNYQVFEKIRKGLGGGLFTAIDLNLDPVLIESSNGESEILVVQCKVGNQKIRVINGYGPQEDEPLRVRLQFWQAMEQEIVSAKSENCMILIEMDANAKLGNEIITQDPHKMSDNGRLLWDLITRESLVLLNSSPLCEGAITRNRLAKDKLEKSIIDFVITCDRLAPFLNNMMINDKRKYPLTKFASTKGRNKIIKSDHNTLFAKFSIDYRNVIWKRPRKEVFNLKNPVCQAKFTEVTNNSQKLRECFLNTLSFPEKCNTFFKTFDDILHQCFRKIRVGGGGRNS